MFAAIPILIWLQLPIYLREDYYTAISLGSVQEIEPGAVNWMTAGSGIVHSERSPKSDRAVENTLHAIQTWVALPEAEEETKFIPLPDTKQPPQPLS